MHQIGAGALGPVFRAYEPDQDRLVAIKLFKLDLAPERVHQLVAELDKLIEADLTHPSIAAPIAAGISGTSAYFAQDFVAADSLDIVVRDHGPAPAAEALRVAAQLGAALDFAAAVDVLHGSLHPRDVLISADDTRVIGLGVTKALERVGVTPPIRRPYTAPERASNAAWDRSADVFALAALIFEMLAGKRLATTADHAGDALASVQGVDADSLKSLFAKALADDPGKRFASALEFADAMKCTITAGVPGSPSGPGRSTSSGPTRTESAATTRIEEGEPGPSSPSLKPASPKSEPHPVLSTRRLETEIALPFDDPRGDTFDVEKRPEPKHEPVDFPLHEDAEPVIQLREPGLAAEPVALKAELRPLKPEQAPLEEPIKPRLPMPPPGPIAPKPEPSPPKDPGLTVAPHEETAAHVTMPQTREPRQKAAASKPDPSAAPAPARSESRGEIRAPEFDLRPEPRNAKAPTAFVDQSTDEFRQSALEKTRSAIWPLALAVGIGLVVGFAGGYGVAMRDRLLPSMGDTQAANAVANGASTPTPAGSTSTSAAPTPGSNSAPPSAVQVPSTTADAPTGALSGSGAASPAPEPPARAGTAAPKLPPDAPERKQPAATAVANGRLVVRSTPPGAKVSVDGKDAGSTPATIRDLTLGPHTVRVAEDGYAAGERRIVLTEDRVSQAMRFDLVKKAIPGVAPPPPPGPGGLMIESRPVGASVFIDGRLVGTTPMQIESVPAGDHTIGLSADGYQRWVGSVRVATGERARVTASLER